MSLSVIICTFNREQSVNDVLDSISRQNCIPEEVIIVDAYEKNINYKIPDNLNVRILKSEVKALTYQRNLGINASAGDIIFFLDDDVILEKKYFSSIINVFDNKANSNIGGVGGYITNQWGQDQNIGITKRIGRVLHIYDGENAPGKVSTSGIFDELNTLQSFTGINEVDFLPGCSMAYKREVFDDYRPPLEINKYGGEDKCFSRMVAQSWKLCIAGDAKLQHLSVSGGARQSDFSETKSTVKFNLYIQSTYGKAKKHTLRLRVYYLFTSINTILISFIMLISVIKFKKSLKWFQRGMGYFFGAFSPAK